MMRKWLRKSVCLCLSLCLFLALPVTATESAAYNTALKLRAPGDADGDGAVTSTDARLILQRSVNKIGDRDLDLTLSDADGNGAVDSTDARLVLQQAVDTAKKAFPLILPYTKLAEKPTGEKVNWRLVTLEDGVGVPYDLLSYGNTVLDLVQTQAEWGHVYETYRLDRGGDMWWTMREGFTPRPMESLDVDPERESLLMIARYYSYLDCYMKIVDVTKKGSCLQLTLRDMLATAGDDMAYRALGVIALPKEVMAGVDSLAVYVDSEKYTWVPPAFRDKEWYDKYGPLPFTYDD